MKCPECNGTGKVRAKAGYSYKRGIACPISALRVEYEEKWCPACAPSPAGKTGGGSDAETHR